MNNPQDTELIAGILAVLLMGLPFLGCGLLFIMEVFWIWMIIDCVNNKQLQQGNDKLVWILIIVFTNWIGALIYFFVQRPKKKQDVNKAT